MCSFADITKPTVKSASMNGTVLYLDMGEKLRKIENGKITLTLYATNVGKRRSKYGTYCDFRRYKRK